MLRESRGRSSWYTAAFVLVEPGFRELTTTGTDAPMTTPAIWPPAGPYRALPSTLPTAMEGQSRTSASPATGLWKSFSIAAWGSKARSREMGPSTRQEPKRPVWASAFNAAASWVSGMLGETVSTAHSTPTLGQS